MNDKADVRQGTLALMVLKTLDVLGPQHGYGIARSLTKTGPKQLTHEARECAPACNHQRGIQIRRWVLRLLSGVLTGLDRNIPVAHVMTMEENVDAHFVMTKAGTAALVFFAVVACTLSAIGLYAVLAAFVNQTPA